jgi:hypothetical protein
MTLFERKLNRRGLLQVGATGGVGVAAFALVGCGDDDDDDEPDATATSDPGSGGGGSEADYPLVHGWYKDEEVVYYDFGMNSPASGGIVASAPIYAFITGMDGDGNPVFVEGQHNIIDVVPGDTGYSDLWEVNLVVVDDAYEADSIKSVGDVMLTDFEVLTPGLFVNCPVVPDGSTFENGDELVQGWYKGDSVFYPDFGMNSPSAVPIWVFITGMNADGTPQFLEGQNNIIDLVPADTGYSAFWQVNMVMAGDDYEPNAIKSAADVMSSGMEVVPTDLVVNCPVVDA